MKELNGFLERLVSTQFLWLVWNCSSIGSFLLMNLLSNLFFTNIKFCKPKVNQGLDLNFNLYPWIHLRVLQVSTNISILIISIYYQYIWVGWSTVKSLILNKCSQSIEKIIKNKIFSIKFGSVFFINTRFISCDIGKHIRNYCKLRQAIKSGSSQFIWYCVWNNNVWK